MMGLVDAVTAALDKNCTASSRLKKKGCAVSLKHAPEPCLIVDFDKTGSPLGKSETRCDYLFVANEVSCAGWIAPLELKKGSLEAGKVVRQLRAGAKAAEKFVSPSEKIKFRPAVAVGNVHKAEIYKLRAVSNKVRFHSHVEAIRLIKCGDPLQKALNS